MDRCQRDVKYSNTLCTIHVYIMNTNTFLCRCVGDLLGGVHKLQYRKPGLYSFSSLSTCVCVWCVCTVHESERVGIGVEADFEVLTCI